MKIDQTYKGLKRLDDGTYVLDGDLISDDDIEIDLDDRLVVKGSIKAGGGIEAGDGIEAGCGIEAGTFIHSEKRIFAGISVYETSETCTKTIKCQELRKGEIAYGELIIAGGNDGNE